MVKDENSYCQKYPVPVSQEMSILPAHVFISSIHFLIYSANAYHVPSIVTGPGRTRRMRRSPCLSLRIVIEIRAIREED